MVTKRLQEYLRRCFTRPGVSFNEEAFGKARAMESTANKAHMTAVEAWQKCTYSGVLLQLGLEEVHVDAALPAIDKQTS